jgi:PPM family protein phosphatase
MSVATPRPPIALASHHATRERAVTLDRGTLLGRDARIESAAASCRGRRHELNEDAHSALGSGRPLYVVADGVGGGAMAARASREVVESVHRLLDGTAAADARRIRDALLVADRNVARMIAAHTREAGAATVALCAAVDDGLSRWLVAWVGDCRVYGVTRADADAALLTRDDSYRHCCELPPAGGSLDDPARMVGNGAVAEPNVIEITLGDDETLVLATDGVHKLLRARDIARLVAEGAAPLARRCTQLVALARARGSVDDATALIVHRVRAAPMAGGATPGETNA